jgi:hypothetical protein
MLVNCPLSDPKAKEEASDERRTLLEIGSQKVNKPIRH